MVGAPQKRAAARHLIDKGMCSQRQACRFVGLSGSWARYRARPSSDEADLVERLKELARKRRRGYRLAHQELRRSGVVVNHKRVYRLWRREGLAVPPRRSRKRIRGVAAGRPIEAAGPDAVWCLDFVEDGILSGGKLRVLCVTDADTLACLSSRANHWRSRWAARLARSGSARLWRI